MKRAAIAAGLCLTMLIAWGYRVSRPSGELRDYGSFVASGRAASEGLNPYGIHPLTFHVVLPGFDVWNPNLNPPASIPAFQLVARVEPQTGFRLWWLFSFACFAAAVLLVATRYGSGPWGVGVLWAFALAGFWDTLALGQIYLPLVLATVIAWRLLESGRPVSAGLLIGVVVAVKPNFAVWPVLLLIAGYWRSAVPALGLAAGLSLVPLVTHGPSIYRQWLEVILADNGRAAFLTNASLPGLAERAGLGSAGLLLGAGLLAGLAWRAHHDKPDPLQTTTLGLLGGIAASPIAWVHYTLFLLPVFFAARPSVLLIAAASLLVVPAGVMLQALDDPLWRQLTVGSTYNWAVVLCLLALTRRAPLARDSLGPARGNTTPLTTRRLGVLTGGR